MIVINQSAAGLQRLLSYPGFKPGVTTPRCKNAKGYTGI